MILHKVFVKIFIKVFVLFLLLLTSCHQYVRSDYNYNSKKARKILITKLPFTDPYNANIILSNKQDVHIDHIVLLKVAHSSGAKYWSKNKKQAFANDLLNMIAVSKKCNLSKGDKTLSQWIVPNNIYFRAEYSNRYLLTIKKYQLK